MMDLSEIGDEFRSAITKYLSVNKPEIIIETGTYHGEGSTRLIAYLIKSLELETSEFYSIECNPENIQKAKDNLNNRDLYDYVNIIEGLSIPRSMLPSHEQICVDIRDAKNKRVFVDHDVVDYGFYVKESQVDNLKEEGSLGKLLMQFHGEIDFLLLDSAGHIGTLEFQYALGHIKAPCAIALDDTKHLKHYRSLEIIKNSKRFKLIHESEDKFGSAIAIYTP